jgi:hypothetical protein
MKRKTVYEDCEDCRVDLGVGGDFVNLFIGKSLGVLFFVRRHYGNRFVELRQFLFTGRSQHRQLAVTVIVCKLRSYHFAELGAGEL